MTNLREPPTPFSLPKFLISRVWPPNPTFLPVVYFIPFVALVPPLPLTSFPKKAAEEFYKALGIPYRVVCLVSGELNDAAIKKYDLEGWFPGQNAYRELVSCSNCTDYQSRAMGTRYGIKKEGQATASYCHFLNSTLCATGRGICAILENHQTETGIVVPECLRPYMGGRDFLEFKRGPIEVSKGEKGKGKKKGGKGGKKSEGDEKLPSPPTAGGK